MTSYPSYYLPNFKGIYPPAQNSVHSPAVTPFGRVPYTCPFQFRERVGHVNWRKTFTVKIDSVISKVDVDTLQKYLSELTYCNLDAEQCLYCNRPVDPALLTLFRLAQLSVEWLAYCQEILLHDLMKVEERQSAAAKEQEHMLDLRRKREERVKVLETELKLKEEFIVNNLNPQLANCQKCQWCHESFSSSFFLQCHLQGFHPHEYKIHYCLNSEIIHLKEENVRLQQELQAISSDSESLKQEYSSLKDQIIEQQQEFLAKTSDRESLKQENSSLKDEIVGLQKELLTKISDSESLKQENSGLKDEIVGQQQEFLAKTSESDSLKQKYSSIKDEIVGLQKELLAKTSDRESLKQETSSLKDQLVGLQQELLAKNSKSESFKQETSSLKDQLVGLQQELLAKNSKSESLTQENSSLMDQIVRLQQEFLAKTSDGKNLKKKTSYLKDQIVRLQQELLTKTFDGESLKQKTSSLENQIVGLLQELQALNHYSESLKQENSSLMGQIIGLQQDLLGNAAQTTGNSSILARLSSIWQGFRKCCRAVGRWLDLEGPNEYVAGKIQNYRDQNVNMAEINRVYQRCPPSSDLSFREAHMMYGSAVKQPETAETTKSLKTAARNFKHKIPSSSSDMESEEEHKHKKKYRPRTHLNQKKLVPTGVSPLSPDQYKQAQVMQSTSSEHQQASASVGGVTKKAVTTLQRDEEKNTDSSSSDFSSSNEYLGGKTQNHRDQNVNMVETNLSKVYQRCPPSSDLSFREAHMMYGSAVKQPETAETTKSLKTAARNFKHKIPSSSSDMESEEEHKHKKKYRPRTHLNQKKLVPTGVSPLSPDQYKQAQVMQSTSSEHQQASASVGGVTKKAVTTLQRDEEKNTDSSSSDFSSSNEYLGGKTQNHRDQNVNMVETNLSKVYQRCPPSSDLSFREAHMMYGSAVKQPETAETTKSLKTAARNFKHKIPSSSSDMESEEEHKHKKKYRPRTHLNQKKLVPTGVSPLSPDQYKQAQVMQSTSSEHQQASASVGGVTKKAVTTLQRDEEKNTDSSSSDFSSSNEYLGGKTQNHRDQNVNMVETNLSKESKINDTARTKEQIGVSAAQKPAGGTTKPPDRQAEDDEFDRYLKECESVCEPISKLAQGSGMSKNTITKTTASEHGQAENFDIDEIFKEFGYEYNQKPIPAQGSGVLKKNRITETTASQHGQAEDELKKLLKVDAPLCGILKKSLASNSSVGSHSRGRDLKTGRNLNFLAGSNERSVAGKNVDFLDTVKIKIIPRKEED